MNRIRYILPLVAALVAAGGTLRAQSDDTVANHSADLVPAAVRPIHPLSDPSRLKDTAELWEFHLSMGTAFVGNSYSSASLFGVRPSFVYRPNNRLTVKGSVSMVNSYSLASNGYALRGNTPRSMAPLRHPENGVAGAVSVSAVYQVNDRLWLAASLMHLGGQLASAAALNPWFFGDHPVDLNATAFTATMRYRIGEDSFLDIHATFIDDRTGALGPLYFGGPYGSPYYYHNATFGGHLF